MIKEALENILLNIIGMIGDLFGMLRSSRTWIFLITLVAAYLAATQSGLHGIDAWLSALIIVVLGGTGMIAKTVRGGAPVTVRPEYVDIDEFEELEETKSISPDHLYPFDVEEFHRLVLNETEQTYTVVNPATIFYKAKDRGMATPAGNLINAQIYWEYLVDLAKEADLFIHGETIEQCEKAIIDKKGTCTGWDLNSHRKQNGMQHYASLLKLQSAAKNLDNLDELVEESTDLNTSYTLYFAGEMAKYLL